MHCVVEALQRRDRRARLQVLTFVQVDQASARCERRADPLLLDQRLRARDLRHRHVALGARAVDVGFRRALALLRLLHAREHRLRQASFRFQRRQLRRLHARVEFDEHVARGHDLSGLEVHCAHRARHFVLQRDRTQRMRRSDRRRRARVAAKASVVAGHRLRVLRLLLRGGLRRGELRHLGRVEDERCAAEGGKQRDGEQEAARRRHVC